MNGIMYVMVQVCGVIVYRFHFCLSTHTQRAVRTRDQVQARGGGGGGIK